MTCVWEILNKYLLKNIVVQILQIQNKCYLVCGPSHPPTPALCPIWEVFWKRRKQDYICVSFNFFGMGRKRNGLENEGYSYLLEGRKRRWIKFSLYFFFSYHEYASDPQLSLILVEVGSPFNSSLTPFLSQS